MGYDSSVEMKEVDLKLNANGRGPLKDSKPQLETYSPGFSSTTQKGVVNEDFKRHNHL